MSVDMEMNLPAGPIAPAQARRAIRDLSSYLSREAYESVELLVSELVTNSFRHAELQEDDAIRLRVRADSRTVHVDVIDPGPGFHARGRTPSSPQGSGWGLYLVDRLSSRWGVSGEGGAHVWFEIDRVDKASSPARTSSRNMADSSS